MAGDARTTEAEPVPTLEERLEDDEARLAADELRLTRDEARLEAEEEQITESRVVAWFGARPGHRGHRAGPRPDRRPGRRRRALRRSVPAGTVNTDAVSDQAVTAEHSHRRRSCATASRAKPSARHVARDSSARGGKPDVDLDLDS